MRETASAHPGAPAVPYWRRVGEDVAHELPGLLGANAIFLGWCAPAAVLLVVGLAGAAALVAPVTLGPGLAGLLTYAGRLARGEPARCWHDSLEGARGRFMAGTALVAVGMGALVLSALAVRLAAAHGVTAGTVAVLAAQVLVVAFVVVACVHAGSLIGLYGQRGPVALRNALLLSLRHPLSSAGLVGLGLLALHLTHAFRGGPLVIVPALLAVCAVHHTRRLAEDAGAIQETTWPPP